LRPDGSPVEVTGEQLLDQITRGQVVAFPAALRLVHR
jgi:hypothetical protein